MTTSEVLVSQAERLYIVEQMTLPEISQHLGVSERSLMRWKKKNSWETKKNQFIESKTNFHEELYNFARKLMSCIEYDIDNDNKVDPGRMYTLTRLLPLITKVKDYEDCVIKKEKDENKGITPDFVQLIESEILGMKPSEEK